MSQEGFSAFHPRCRGALSLRWSLNITVACRIITTRVLGAHPTPTAQLAVNSISKEPDNDHTSQERTDSQEANPKYESTQLLAVFRRFVCLRIIVILDILNF